VKDWNDWTRFWKKDFKTLLLAKAKDIDDPEAITTYIQKLDAPLSQLTEAVRQLILKADKSVGEQIKWNSPSFFYKGEMKPFDPKEYKRDIVVMNLRSSEVLLVFPTGAKVKDTSGLLEGDYKDGRRLARFTDPDDVKAKGKALQKVVKEWIKLVDK